MNYFTIIITVQYFILFYVTLINKRSLSILINIIVDNRITLSFQHHYAQIIDIKR